MRLSSRSKSVSMAILLACCGVASGCAPEPPAPTPYPTAPPTETVPPSPTALEITPVIPTLEPTATPVAELMLNGGFSDVSYLIPLTLQHVTPTGALLFFELSRPAEAAVFCWPSIEVVNYAVRQDLAADSASHQVKLEGLSPGMEYQVAVGVLDHLGVYLPPTFAKEADGNRKRQASTWT